MSLWSPLCCFVATRHLSSQSFSIVLRCGDLLLHVILLERQVYPVARLCPVQTFLSLCHRRHVAALCILHKLIKTRINVCSVSFHLLLSKFDIPSCGCSSSITLEFEVSRCRTCQFARCFLPAQTRVWNDLRYTVFDTRTLDGFKGAVNRLLFRRYLLRNTFEGIYLRRYSPTNVVTYEGIHLRRYFPTKDFTYESE